MKANKTRQRLSVTFLTAMICTATLLFASNGFPTEIKKVAVLPFVMNTQEDLTILQKGIFDMFSSRISHGDDVVVLTRENLDMLLSESDNQFPLDNSANESIAKALGGYLNVDYVLFGSLTLFGNSMSLDVNIVDIKTNQPTLSFYRQGDNAGSVIPELNKISEEINFKVFGREPLGFQPQTAPQKSHAIEEDHQYLSPLGKFNPLLNVNGMMTSVASGDLDGDNKNEIVVVYDRKIQILRCSFDGKIMPLKTINDDSVASSLVSVDAADINGNGYEEIFLTRINIRNQSVNSHVIEYDGSRFIRKQKGYKWYFKVIKYLDGHKELFAQEHSQKGPWFPRSVFKVNWVNNDYLPGEKVNIPKNKDFSILSMTAATHEIAKGNSYLYTDAYGHLTLINDSGKIEWSSDKGYGGSTLFYEFPKERASTSDRTYVYLQPNNIVFDIENDGKPELFAIKNIETSNYLFKNIRTFKNGSIKIIGWNEMDKTFEKVSKKLPGMITSLAISDYDNDSKMELLVTIVKKGSGSFSRKKKSVLAAYELNN